MMFSRMSQVRPGDPPVLLDKSGYGEDNLIGHHLIRTGHGLEHRARGSQLLLALVKEAPACSPPRNLA